MVPAGLFRRRNSVKAKALHAGHEVAEEDDEVGLQAVGDVDDLLDARQRHPRIAGVDIGDRGDADRPGERREAFRPQAVAGHVEAEARLDGEGIGRQAEGCDAPGGNQTEKGTSCQHAA